MRRRPISTLALGGVLLVVSAALGLGVGLLGARADAGAQIPVVSMVLPLAGAVLLLAGTTVYWRRLDEAAREAHKWAWFWGGSAGLFLAGAFVGAVPRVEGAPWRGWAIAPTDSGLVATGVLICVAVQVLGYAVAWSLWWLRRR